MNSILNETCLFCKIIKKEVPSIVLYESERTMAFMDIYPLSKGHILVMPKFHAAKMHEVPDEFLREILPVSKILAKAIMKTTNTQDYNILQNNGRLAHQEIDHAHFHLIPKTTKDDGLLVQGAPNKANVDELQVIAKEIISNM